jgi:hypothetical protein
LREWPGWSAAPKDQSSPCAHQEAVGHNKNSFSQFGKG